MPVWPHWTVTTRLVVSLSGINARTVDRCAELSLELARRNVPLSLLFAPRVAGSDATVIEWVRERCAAGDALLLHGFDHAAEPRGRGVGLGRRAEFAALPAHEAGLRLTAATAALERVGLSATCFAPPRWLASRGTLIALQRKGFRLCAEVGAVRDLRTDTVYKGRVAPWWGRHSRRGGLIRFAVDSSELARPGLLDAVDSALHHGASAITYPDLLTPPLARAA
jgi:predicted deacetylase